ncbi:uncharacterized protein SAPINGB_P002516 [Magnusiomyces paraingens]|uniref:Cas1p 10 TM acyl transferase domain-containing protein n=1 Tax=Magnusiomyces paraingens TaxID=2606893 RepID=A0A5E8BEC1_9ASCO|nr:uncharacterized protein SAPINGB_P002516 [Saprochaete ingens]VVT49933.1 unnamed protein product [Saprochaete ingens]
MNLGNTNSSAINSWKWLQFNLVAVPILLLSIAFLTNLRTRYTYGSAGCNSILKGGRYLDNPSFFPHQWQPDGCTLHKYSEQTSPNELSPCILPGDEIIFYGDSTGRQIFHAMGNLIQQGAVLDAKTHTVSFNVHNITITFVWAPFFNDTGNDIIKDIAKLGPDSEYKKEANGRATPDALRPPKTFLIATGGFWFARDLGEEAPKIFKERLQSLVDTILNAKPGAFENSYFVPIMMPYYLNLSDRNRDFLTPESVGNLLTISDEVFSFKRGSKGGPGKGGEIYSSLDSSKLAINYVPVVSNLAGENNPGLFDSKGVHFAAAARYVEANIFLNHMCNKELALERQGFDKEHDIESFSGTCCVQYPKVSYLHLAGAILIITVGCMLLFKVQRDYLFKAVPILVTILYVYTAERTHTFNTTMLFYDSRNLLVFLQISFFLGLFFIKEGKPIVDGFTFSENFILEFKGICIVMLILIEFTGYDLEFDEFSGAILGRIFYSCWTAFEVYQFTLELFRSKSFSPKERSLFLGIKFIRLLFLPTIISFVLTYKESPSIFHYWGPTVVRLAFWYMFVISFHPATKFVPEYLKNYLPLFLVFFGFIMYPISSSIDLGREAISISYDYVLIFLSVASAICGSLTSSNYSLDFKQSYGRTFFAALIFAIVINIAYYLVPVYFPSVIGSLVNPSLLECNNNVREAAIFFRGLSYTPISHFFLTLIFVVTWIALRTQISPNTYMNFFVESGKCSYEAIVLRFHIALTASGSVLLWLLPGGSGVVVSGLLKRAYQVISKDTPINNFEFPGELTFQAKCIFNALLVFTIFSLLVSSLGSIWANLKILQPNNDIETLEKSSEMDP